MKIAGLPWVLDKAGGTLFSKAQSAATTADVYVTEDAVMASEIGQLPELTGFLKLASLREWRRVTVSSA